MDQFLHDVLKGLNSSPKYLESKYFYDKRGDEIFRKIMNCREYYLSDCEMQILEKQTSKIVDCVLNEAKELDVVEFGPGDATKSVHLLKELTKRKALGTYFPIDISENIIRLLNTTLPKKVPQLKMQGLHGEYLDMLSEATTSNKKKLVLFLGANIGNFKNDEMHSFCKDLHAHLQEGDQVLIGFDIKKDPWKILAAYNDKQGYTRKFNLNLLRRINEELNADFNLKKFEHFPTYDPVSGACTSYLISTRKQRVSFGQNAWIDFEKNEEVFMEVSQKYSVAQIDEIASQTGFAPVADFFDKKNCFVDVIWKIQNK